MALPGFRNQHEGREHTRGTQTRPTLPELGPHASLPGHFEEAVLGFLRTPQSVDIDKIVEL